MFIAGTELSYKARFLIVNNREGHILIIHVTWRLIYMPSMGFSFLLSDECHTDYVLKAKALHKSHLQLIKGRENLYALHRPNAS